MSKSGKYVIILLVFTTVFLAVFLLFQDRISKFYSDMSKLSTPEDIGNFLLEKIEKEISAPPPLRHTADAPQAFLTRAGVINWTNEQRQKNGLAPLKENPELDASAKLKVSDMFVKQYFEHISPTGVGIDVLVQEAGYEYILIGENLAMGNFENSEKLVEAWMDSPGHRENILNSRYEEIGVAVLEGIYEGKKTWMAVQHFGLPMSHCVKPSENLKAEIADGNSQLDQLKNYLDALKIEIEKMNPRTREEVDSYNQRLKEYNSDIKQYNLLVEEIRNMINSYNQQVGAFNACLKTP